MYTVGVRRKIVVVAHNIRSTYNVGSLLRTCDGLAIDELVLSGYTPYPKSNGDDRLPHVAERAHRQIQKTALGAEESVKWRHITDLQNALNEYKKKGYLLAALEQIETSQPLNSYEAPDKLVLILGEELSGVNTEILKLCDEYLEIPMLGKKESFNVAQAAAMALYHLRLIRT